VICQEPDADESAVLVSQAKRPGALYSGLNGPLIRPRGELATFDSGGHLDELAYDFICKRAG